MPHYITKTAKHVTSLPLSEKLRDADFDQKGGEFYWLPSTGKQPLEPCWKGTWNEVSRHKICRAWLASELLEMLPRYIEGEGALEVSTVSLSNIGGDRYAARFRYDEVYSVVYARSDDEGRRAGGLCNEKLADALGDKVLWCKENGHL